MLKNLIITSLLLFGSVLGATYVYEDNQDLYDLRNYSGTTNLNVGDDQVSAKFNFGFDFTYYDNTFTFARMATNGCLHFGLNSTGYNDYCGDYTPDPLPQYTNTLFPFWTDLIRDNGSKMLAKNVLDSNDEDLYTIFGWYNLREYNRSNTDNSFEVWLYPNNTFEYRYGALNIVQHDVLIGEQGPTTSDIYQYYFHDECNTGTTNTSSCVSQSWNQSTMNTTLESGGSLYGLGSGNALDCSSPLNNEACVGYAAAYLTQQCGLDSLYDTSCPLYWDAYDDLQCNLDPQYAPFCAGYTQEDSVAYYDPDEYDYGYEDETNYGYEYEDEYYVDSCIDDPSYCYDDDPYADMYFTDAEWYEIDLEEFGQEQVDEWYGTDVEFTEEGYINYDEYDTTEEDYWTNIDEGMEEYDAEQEAIWAAEELAWQEEQDRIYEEEYFQPEESYEEDLYFVDSYNEDSSTLTVYEEEIFDIYEEHYDTDYDLVYNVVGEEEFIELYEFNTIITEEIEYEEEDNYVAFENMEELEDWYEEEMEESHETSEEQVAEVEEESYEEDIEEIYEDIEEEWLAEVEEEVVLEDLEEVELVGTLEREGSSMDMETALSVVASTVQTATASVSGTTSGTSIHATGNTVASGGSGGATTTTVSSSVSSGGISTSSSPSISAQVSAAAIQTQNILSTLPDTMTTTSSIVETSADVEVTTSSVASTSTDNTNVSTSSSSVNTTGTTDTSEVSTQVAVVEVQVQDMQGQIDTAVVDAGTASEADQIADQIIAQNIQSQQQEAETYQQETGQYGDQSTLVAYLGYNAGFTDYYDRSIPGKEDWYEPRVIYADAYLGDNINAFYKLAGDSLNTLQQMRDLQPTL